MEKRITDLEIKFAHLDEFIFQMNKVVADQQNRIERLERELKDQRDRMELQASGATLENTKPPHY
jgi:uncharacterized coiled-coil protein SlyX